MAFRPIHIATIALLFLAAGCGQKNDSKIGDQQQSQIRGTADGSANVAEVFAITRRPDKVPNFSWKDGTGRTADFDSFHGKVTLINLDRKSTRLNSSHIQKSRMPSSA